MRPWFWSVWKVRRKSYNEWRDQTKHLVLLPCDRFCDRKGDKKVTSKTGKKAAKSLKLAEREGFEPSVRVTPYDSLANCWFQPLTHRSTRVPFHMEGAGLSIEFHSLGQQLNRPLQKLSRKEAYPLCFFSHCGQMTILEEGDCL